MITFPSQLLRLAQGLVLLPALILAVLPGRALAWSDHASLLWPAMQSLPELLEPSVPAETLETFLAAEAPALAGLLATVEQRARDTLPHYAPRPAALAFNPQADDLRQSFLMAIRVNPTLAYVPYRQLMAGEPTPAEVLAWSDLSFLSVGTSHQDTAYLDIASGTPVAPAHIVASASDEPDFGIDIGLFDDNGTSFGQRYGFGAQPFGNPNLEYGSQAPFHMGFYHLDWLARTARPELLRSYPAWRVALFGELSAFAFQTGHPYWGWRFAGWALHYIGDLTQPYHADPLPGVSTLAALWAVARGRSGEIVQLVSNRHGVLESYQYQRVREALAAGDAGHPLLVAATGAAPLPTWTDGTFVDELCATSVAAGVALDRALVGHVPSRYVSDPTFEWTGSGEERSIVARIRAEGGDAALDALDAALVPQLQRFGRYARSWIDRTWRAAAAARPLAQADGE